MTAQAPLHISSTGQVIIDHAMALFAERQYEGTSMRDIAASVGVKPASIYNHFPSKEDILWRIVVRAWDELWEMQAEASARTDDATLAQFRSFVRTHTLFHALNSQLARVVNRQLRSLRQERLSWALQQRDEYTETLRKLIRKGRREGLFAPLDVSASAFAILDVGMGTARWFKHGGRLDEETLAGVHELLALRAVGWNGA